MRRSSRHASGLSAVVKNRLLKDRPDEDQEYARLWVRIWRILSSVCNTRIWIQRNRVTFHHETVTLDGSVNEFWASGMRQLRAVAKREYRMTDTQIRGARLLLCQQLLARQPGEPSPMVTIPTQSSDSQEEPALLTRLRIYQTSCSH